MLRKKNGELRQQFRLLGEDKRLLTKTKLGKLALHNSKETMTHENTTCRLASAKTPGPN